MSDDVSWPKLGALAAAILAAAMLVTFAHVVLVQRTFVVRPAEVKAAVGVVHKAVDELKDEVRLLREAVEGATNNDG